jgi:hypothetical protein
MLRASSCLAMLALSLVLHCLGGEAYAGTCYYVGPDGGSWHIPDNWSSGHVPRWDDGAMVFDDLTVRITGDVPDPPRPFPPAYFTISVGHVHDGAIIQDSGLIEVTGMYIGRQGEVGYQYKGTYILNGGTMHVGDFLLGESLRENTFVMNGGSLEVGRLALGSGNVYHPEVFGYTHGSGFFIQNDGTVTASLLILGVWSESIGVYKLNGGTLHLGEGYGPPSLGFGPRSENYFDFNGGVMYLPGDWNFDRLVGIDEDSDFRAFGKPATKDNLAFDLVVIGDGVYTQIFAIPEPSALVLLSMAVLALLAYAWRWRRAA